MTEEWVRKLATAVVEKLGKRFENILPALDGSHFFPALAASAQEQHVDITSDKGTLRFAISETRRVARDMVRKNQATVHRSVTNVPTKGWLEHALPPGDRD